MLTFKEFVNESILLEAHKNIELGDGWILQQQPHFEDRHNERNASITMKDFYDRIFSAVSKMTVPPGKKDWNKNEVAFVHTKSGTKIVANLDIPKKLIRTMTYLDDKQVPKVGTKVIRLREGEYEILDDTIVTESMDVIEVIYLDEEELDEEYIPYETLKFDIDAFYDVVSIEAMKNGFVVDKNDIEEIILANDESWLTGNPSDVMTLKVPMLSQSSPRGREVTGYLNYRLVHKESE